MARMVLCLLTLMTVCKAWKVMKFQVLEEQKADTFVGDISQSQTLQGFAKTEENIQYNISTTSLQKVFRIDSNGKITTAARIDRESLGLPRDTFQFDVEAWKGQNKFTLQAVEIKILDENDHIPKFTKDVYVGEVKENSRAGTFVLNVMATDKDIGTNGEVVYSLQIHSRYKDLFTLDARTGELRTNAALDYEFSKDYQIKVTARDKGPGLNSSDAIVNVKVLDENEITVQCFSDKFDSPYQATLSGETAVGTSILRVSAEDEGSGSSGQLTYAFDTSVDEFRINSSSGIVYTAKRIEVGVRKSLLFAIVSAVDHGTPTQCDFATVQIRMNRTTRFSQAAHKASIPEDTKPGTSVVTVSAIDDFDLNVANISYELKFGDPQSLFRIGHRSGVIEVNKDGLDYETESKYFLGVEARDDSTNKSVVVEVNITIIDVNDNPPVFDPANYFQEVSEDVPNDTIILRVNASDRDSGLNGHVMFSIRSGNDKQSFKIDSTTGEIVTIKPLDHESVKEHKLLVEARDEGLKRKKSHASVTIKVGDINDNIPEFYIPHPDKVAVEENSPVGTSFYVVTAVDHDSGNYGAVKYSILGGSGWGLFVIDSFSGELSTNATFDYETRNRYVLKVKAEDRGSPPLTSNVNLTVYIKSLDESEPKFEKSSYEFDILGNAKIGDVVGQVVATDEDEGEDGVVRYSFEFSILSVFAINGTSGVIFVNKALEEVNSTRRSRRSVDLADEESIGSHRRARRETEVRTVMLRVRADSGKANSKMSLVRVEVGIYFACLGCPTTGARDDEDDGGIAGSTLIIIIVLAVLAGVILIAFIIVMVTIYMQKKNKKRNQQHLHLRCDGSIDRITVYPQPLNRNINLANMSTPHCYSQKYSPLNSPSNLPALGTKSSDTPNSASGQGPVKVVITHENIGSLHLENYVVGGDPRIKQAAVRQLPISNKSSMGQVEGPPIDNQTHKRDKSPAELGAREYLHVLDEGGDGMADGGVHSRHEKPTPEVNPNEG